MAKRPRRSLAPGQRAHDLLSLTAARLAERLDVELVVAGLAAHIAVFDRAAFLAPDAGRSTDIGGYAVRPREEAAWDTITAGDTI